MNQTCLLTNLIVASCVNYDFWWDKIMWHTIHGIGKFTGKMHLQQVEFLLRKYNFALLSQQQILASCNNCKKLIRTELIREWWNAQHHFSTHFAAILNNRLLIFAAPFTTALLSTYLANFMISTFQNINF